MASSQNNVISLELDTEFWRIWGPVSWILYNYLSIYILHAQSGGSSVHTLDF